MLAIGRDNADFAAPTTEQLMTLSSDLEPSEK